MTLPVKQATHSETYLAIPSSSLNTHPVVLASGSQHLGLSTTNAARFISWYGIPKITFPSSSPALRMILKILHLGHGLFPATPPRTGCTLSIPESHVFPCGSWPYLEHTTQACLASMAGHLWVYPGTPRLRCSKSQPS